MQRVLFSLVWMLGYWSAFTAFADATIAPENWVYNATQVQCGWAAIETVGRHYGIKSLIGITKTHTRAAQPQEMLQLLAGNKIDSVYQLPGERAIDLLESVNKGLPVIAGIRFNGVAHAIIVTSVNFDKQQVVVIDNAFNDHQLRVWNMTQFFDLWDGFTLVINPPQPAQTVATAK